MRELHLDFLEQAFIYHKDDSQWQLTLKRSDVASQTLEELVLLDLHHPLFLEQTTVFDDDDITFTYALPKDGLSYEAVKKRLMSERLRLALNLLDLEQALSLPVTFFLHPEICSLLKTNSSKSPTGGFLKSWCLLRWTGRTLSSRLNVILSAFLPSMIF